MPKHPERRQADRRAQERRLVVILVPKERRKSGDRRMDIRREEAATFAEIKRILDQKAKKKG